MLIVTRKVGQVLLIGDNIKVVVHEIKSGSKVVLAIEAPREIQITRDDANWNVPRPGPKTPDKKDEGN